MRTLSYWTQQDTYKACGTLSILCVKSKKLRRESDLLGIAFPGRSIGNPYLQQLLSKTSRNSLQWC
jgi:hypothetical protein